MPKVNWLFYPKSRSKLNDPEGTDYSINIGKLVAKGSGGLGSQPKPFSSGSKVNTVKSVINHPIRNVPAYTFEEDDTYVECHRCYVVDACEPLWFLEEHEFCECGNPYEPIFNHWIHNKPIGVRCPRCKFKLIY